MRRCYPPPFLMEMKMDWKPIGTAKQGIREPEILLYGSYLYPGDMKVTEYWYVGRWASCTGPNALVDGWETSDGIHADGFFSHWAPLSRPS